MIAFNLGKAELAPILEIGQDQSFFPKLLPYQRPREGGHFLPAVFFWIVAEDFTEKPTYNINDVVQADGTDASLVKRGGRQQGPLVVLWIITLDLGGEMQLWEQEFTTSLCLDEAAIH